MSLEDSGTPSGESVATVHLETGLLSLELAFFKSAEICAEGLGPLDRINKHHFYQNLF